MFCFETDLRLSFYIISSSEIRGVVFKTSLSPSARQEITIFHITLRVIILFTTARHLFLPRARPIQSTPSCPISSSYSSSTNSSSSSPSPSSASSFFSSSSGTTPLNGFWYSAPELSRLFYL